VKLKSARIKNFKLLRDVRLDFSDDATRPLTVIRAENGSGKTSTLMALRWALYGQDGLDDSTMRLSATTWPEGTECEITVQLDFSHTLYNVIAGEAVGSTTDYRLVRTARERPANDRPNRTEDRVVLYRIGEGGLEKVDPPDLAIGEMLPPEMQHIFFTDGDAALTFISPQLSKTSRRDQVREAIRSLLGVGLLEGASQHVAAARKHFNTEVSKASTSDDLAKITKELSDAQDRLTRDDDRLQNVEKQVEELARRYEEADKRLELALQAGDHDDLARQQNAAKLELTDARNNEQPLRRQHQQLLEDERVSLVLMGSSLQSGFAELAKLHEAGVIPSGSLPVIEERLELESCICGTSLAPGTDARLKVEELIAEQRSVDESRQVLTELHHAAKVDLQRAASAGPGWLEDLERLERTRLANRRAVTAAEERLRVLEQRIARIDKAAIAECRKDRDSLRVSLNDKQDERRALQVDIDRGQALIAELKPRQGELLRKDRRLGELTSRLTVTEDVAAVVRGVLDDLQQTYVDKVSERMNNLFLEMVGADPESMAELASDSDTRERSAVFTAAEITPQYEIVVRSGDRTLSPEHELNGASKRALTFSFIWALTEVSLVHAPRIVDTPLGMMSGRVKQRVIELITQPESGAGAVEKQVVLFLTRDEIRGIEPILDDRAGRIFTFSNSDHYPIDLVNAPDVDSAEILRCECDHRQVCRICARRNDDQYELVERPVV
jgi:DNA sulfur modification protein DndD